MKIAHLNVLGARFSSPASWADRRAAVRDLLAATGADVVTLCECYGREDAYLSEQLGMRRIVKAAGVVILARVPAGRTWMVPLDSYHAGVIAEITKDGQTYNVAAAHLLPSKTSTSTARRAQLAKITGFMAGWSDPTILAGDLNDADAGVWLTAAGYKLPSQPQTMPGFDHGPDYLAAKGTTLHDLAVIKTGPASDHNGLTGHTPARTADATTTPTKEDTIANRPVLQPPARQPIRRRSDRLQRQ